MKKNTCKNNSILTKTVVILIAGILVGFLIGRISFVETIPAQNKGPAPAVPAATSVQKSTENLAQEQQPAAITPLALDKVSGVSPDDDEVFGNPAATLTVVEFTDYQCPYCKRYFDETYLRLKKDYVDTGKIRYVVRDFPLDEHPQAMLAAAATECAGEQGKFADMHDKLFSTQDQWSYRSEAIGIFKTYAATMGLDKGTFDDCIDNGKYDNEIAKDISDGQSYTVKSTPTIFIGDRKIVGAQTYELFTKNIDEVLMKTTAPQ
jgi:protein-disulfide isomerase